MWKYTGKFRPEFAEKPGPGQESVWDYPRPPAIRLDSRLVVVKAGDLVIARSRNAVRVCETASPPTFYIPGEDVKVKLLQAVGGTSFCEWKGSARYWALASNPGLPVGWEYPNPNPAFEELKAYFSFYPARVICRVDGEVVRPQPGGFYGGWITDEIVGPFKGEPGTAGW